MKMPHTTKKPSLRGIDIPCPVCGVLAQHRTEAGAGPHHGKLVCTSCGSFIKWLKKPRETPMYLNECFLAGEIARDPEVSFSNNGTQITNIALCLREERDGKEYKTYVPVECWGKSAEVLAEMQQGDPVFIKGKLRWKSWTKDGEKQGRLEVSSWSVQPVVAPEPVGERN